MAWSIDERFPSWGESGEFPVAGFFYEGGDQVNEKHLDALWNGVNGLEEDIQAALSDIDADSDGIVDEADTTNLYKNNDIDTNGDGVVDAADDADTVDGEHASAFADTNHGNEEHSSDFTTLSEVNTSADVPNADFADNAGNANEYSGLAPSDGTSGEAIVTDGTNVSFSKVGQPIYGTGEDGNITHSTTVSDSGIVYAQNYTVESGATVNVTDGVLIVFATESITVNGTIDGSGSVVGGGGAGGSQTISADGGNGGGGGALVILAAPRIEVSGTIDVSGEDGEDGENGQGTSDQGGDSGASGALGVFGGGASASGEFPAAGGDGGDVPDFNAPGTGGNSIMRKDENVSNRALFSSHLGPIYELCYDFQVIGGAAGGGGGGGANGVDAEEQGGGGGGGGGSGGGIMIVAQTLTESAPNYDLSAGLGGNGGLGASGGENGDDGADGDTGYIAKIVS